MSDSTHFRRPLQIYHRDGRSIQSLPRGDHHMLYYGLAVEQETGRLFAFSNEKKQPLHGLALSLAFF